MEVGPREERRLFQEAALQEIMNKAAEVAERQVDEGFTKYDKQAVLVSSKLGKFETNSLVDAAPDAVATDSGLQDFFRDDDTKTLELTRVRSINQRQEGCADSLPFLIDIAHATTRMKTVFLG